MSREGRAHPPPVHDDETRGASPDSGLFGLDCPLEEASVAVLPVPFEATVSFRSGTAAAPGAILEASHQVELFDVCLGAPCQAGVTMLGPPEGVESLSSRGRGLAEPIIRAGGADPNDPRLMDTVSRVDAICSAMNQAVQAEVARQLEEGRIPGVLGGEHSVAFGAIAAVSRRWPGLGVLQIDAHADLRKGYEGFTWSHASVMDNVLNRLPGVSRLVQVGVRDLCEAEYLRIDSDPRISTWFGPRLEQQRLDGRSWIHIARDIVSALPGRVHVSFDIDGLHPSLCPNTGTPVPGGLAFEEAMTLLHAVVASGRTIVGFDLTEVAPGGHACGWDAIVGARVLFKLIGFSLLSQKRISPGPLFQLPERPDDSPCPPGP